MSRPPGDEANEGGNRGGEEAADGRRHEEVGADGEALAEDGAGVEVGEAGESAGSPLRIHCPCSSRASGLPKASGEEKTVTLDRSGDPLRPKPRDAPVIPPYR